MLQSSHPTDKVSESEFLQHELSHQALRNERARAAILMSAFAVMLVVMPIVAWFFPHVTRFLGHRVRLAVLVSIVGVALCIELGMWWMLGALERRGLSPPAPARYFSAFVEVSVPTFIAYYMGSMVYPIHALLGPAAFIYFILIMLSALRLDFGICVFTGAVSATQYAALVYRALQDPRLSQLHLDPFLIAPFHHAEKTLIILLAGFIAGAVTRQLRKHVLSALRTVQDRDRVVELFGRHVSPEVVNKLLAQPNLEGELRQVCVMFLDIRNFTGFSEGRDPKEVVQFLNRLFAPLIDCVNGHQGIINKFLGDGFMAVFGAPLADGEAARNAVRASREMLRAVTRLCDAGHIPPTRIGIGLHVGEAVTGIVGSAHRKEYTIIGDVVNLASRIEGLNKQFGSQLLVSAAVREQSMPELAGAIPRGPVQIKGRADTVEIYQADPLPQ